MSAVLYVGLLMLLASAVKAYTTEDVGKINIISKSILFAIDEECGYSALYVLREFVKNIQDRQKYMYMDIDSYSPAYLKVVTSEFRHCVKEALQSIHEQIESCYTGNTNDSDGFVRCLLTIIKEQYKETYGFALDENDQNVKMAIPKFTTAFVAFFDMCDNVGCIEVVKRVIWKALHRCYDLKKPEESSEKRVLNDASLFNLNHKKLNCDNLKSLYDNVKEALDEELTTEITTSGTPPAKKALHADTMAGKSIADLLRALRHLKPDN